MPARRSCTHIVNMCQRQRRQRRVTHDEALGELPLTWKPGTCKQLKRERVVKGGRDKITRRNAAEEGRHETSHQAPKREIVPLSSLLLLFFVFFCFSFSALSLACPFVPLTITRFSLQTMTQSLLSYTPALLLHHSIDPSPVQRTRLDQARIGRIRVP